MSNHTEHAVGKISFVDAKSGYLVPGCGAD